MSQEENEITYSVQADNFLKVCSTYIKENNLPRIISVESLCLTLLNTSPSVDKMFKELKIKKDEIKKELFEYFKKLPAPDLDADSFSLTDEAASFIYHTDALFSINENGSDNLYELNMIESVFAIARSFSYKVFSQYIDRIELNNYINDFNEKEILANQEKQEFFKDPLLLEMAEDVTEKAAKKELDALICRDTEILRIEHILCRKKKNNPIIVGEAGVGKTSLIEGLAQRIVDKTSHESLWDYKVFSLNVSNLVSGTKFRGEFEKKVDHILKIASENKVILFIDEIHNIIGVGSQNGVTGDFSNILKPYLTKGNLAVVGATTTAEYRRIFEKDAALARRFNKVEVQALNEEDTLKVLFTFKEKFEKWHKVSYEKEAIEQIVKLTSRYIKSREFPDKAIDIMDEVGVKVKLRNKEKIVTVSDVEEVVSYVSNQPVQSLLKSNEIKKLQELPENLAKNIFGQDSAIEQLVDVIHLAKAGLKKHDKPIASFLFLGPTGVGKTELVKQLSASMGLPLHRYDMSEFSSAHNVARLVGAPAGYIGHGKGGQLTEEVNKNPHSIFLFDEIEKAHPDIFNIFLQIMDYGSLTDAEGRSVDFRNSIIVMTSNAGVKLYNHEKNTIGFISSDKEKSAIDRSAVNMIFKPEFRNRLDSIVEFNSMNKDMMINIVKKNIKALEDQLTEKKITIEYNDEVLTYISEKGFDKDMGARPVERLIQNEISKPISKIILFKDVKDGDRIHVSVKDNNLHVTHVTNLVSKELLTVENQKVLVEI